jgi:hypothetical protein
MGNAVIAVSTYRSGKALDIRKMNAGQKMEKKVRKLRLWKMNTILTKSS